MSAPHVAVLVATLALALGPCTRSSQQQSQVKGGAVVITRETNPRAVPFAPAGTSFDVKLNEAIDTRTSSRGQAVSATLAQPIVAFDGDVLVEPGTTLRGTVAGIERGEAPRVDLEFDTILLRGGAVPIGTRVLSAQQSFYRSLPASGVTSMQPPAGAQPPGSVSTVQISISKGATIRIALTTPVVDGRTLD